MAPRANFQRSAGCSPFAPVRAMQHRGVVTLRLPEVQSIEVGLPVVRALQTAYQHHSHHVHTWVFDFDERELPEYLLEIVVQYANRLLALGVAIEWVNLPRPAHCRLMALGLREFPCRFACQHGTTTMTPEPSGSPPG